MGDQGDPNFYDEYKNVPKEADQLQTLSRKIADLRNKLGPVAHLFAMLEERDALAQAMSPKQRELMLNEAMEAAEEAWRKSAAILKDMG